MQQQLVSFTNNLKQEQILRNYRSEYDKNRGKLAQRTGNLAGQTIERLESREAELERLATKLLRRAFICILIKDVTRTLLQR